MISGTSVCLACCIAEHKQAVPYSMCRAAIENEINWSDIHRFVPNIVTDNGDINIIY